MTGIIRDKQITSLASLDTSLKGFSVPARCYLNTWVTFPRQMPVFHRKGLVWLSNWRVVKKHLFSSCIFQHYLNELKNQQPQGLISSPAKKQGLKQIGPYCCNTNKTMTLCLSMKIVKIQSPVKESCYFFMRFFQVTKRSTFPHKSLDRNLEKQSSRFFFFLNSKCWATENQRRALRTQQVPEPGETHDLRSLLPPKSAWRVEPY